MTKAEALALTDGDVVYVIDDSRWKPFDENSIDNSPLRHHGLQRAVIGAHSDHYGLYHHNRVQIIDTSGYLDCVGRHGLIPPSMIFRDPREALAAFEAHVAQFQARISEINATLDRHLVDAHALVERELASHTP